MVNGESTALVHTTANLIRAVTAVVEAVTASVLVDARAIATCELVVTAGPVGGVRWFICKHQQ